MSCQRCDGSGEVVICIDDLCRAGGECIHDDDVALCPDCHGSGDAPYDEGDEADYRYRDMRDRECEEAL